MNKLFIDTSGEEIIVRITAGNKTRQITKSVKKHRPQVVLNLVEDLLAQEKITIEQVDEIEVNRGPGSFTGLRVGISVANTLSAFLKIPINGQAPGTVVDALYA